MIHLQLCQLHVSMDMNTSETTAVTSGCMGGGGLLATAVTSVRDYLPEMGVGVLHLLAGGGFGGVVPTCTGWQSHHTAPVLPVGDVVLEGENVKQHLWSKHTQIKWRVLLLRHFWTQLYLVQCTTSCLCWSSLQKYISGKSDQAGVHFSLKQLLFTIWLFYKKVWIFHRVTFQLVKTISG